MSRVLRLFQERLRGEQPRTVLVRGLPGDSGVTVKDGKGKVLEVGVPVTNTAAGRTVRLHESLHAAYSALRLPEGLHPWTLQAIEDARLHSACWPKGYTSVDRDAQVMALREMRALSEMWERLGSEELPMAITALVRSATTLYTTAYSEHMKVEQAGKNIPREMVEALVPVLVAIRERQWELAARTLDPLMKGVAGEMPREDESLESAATGAAAFDPDASVEVLGPPTAVWDAAEGRVVPGEGEERKRKVIDGKIGRPRMKIVELQPRHEPTELAKARARTPAAMGTRIRSHKLAGAVVSNNARGLFSRPAKRFSVAGTVLVDASGSMRVTAKKLLVLLKSAPGATLAYYDSPDEMEGTLWVAARNGRMYQGSLPHMGGGNGVDLEALQWLLKQAGPRIFVTDKAFTGTPAEAKAAKVLLAQAERLKLVTWVRTLQHALVIFARALHTKRPLEVLMRGYGTGDSKHAPTGVWEFEAQQWPEWEELGGL